MAYQFYFSVRISPDFSTGYIRVLQLVDSQKTVIPERSVLLKTRFDSCLVKHRERIRLAKDIYYEVSFPPCDRELETSSSIGMKMDCSVVTYLISQFDIMGIS